tara:strand:+ start:17613 stop:19073 length:1461 start_codon:yes stop_codon:yes gene_type:complete
MTDLHELSILELSKGLRDRKFSSVEVTKHFLKRIKELDGQLNSFITVTEEEALVQAHAADKKIFDGQANVLSGIPIAHKDIFCTKGIRTSCGSKMLDKFISPYDASVVSNLKKADMVMLGKTNMDEFAMGSSNETSFYGAVKNPWDISCVPGGSSGGSAAATAARLCAGATGTDTGGSIRQPAALNGITGLKPTYGRCSRFGMIAFASSLDQAGTMTRSAMDAALMLGGMAGFDEKDSTSVDKPVENYAENLNRSIRGLKVGIVKEFMEDNLNQGIASSFEKVINQLKSLGAEIVEVSLPNIHLSVSVYYVVAPAECSSNLSRFDGIRYGHRCSNPENLEDLYKRSRSEGFGAEVKRRIMMGTYALSAGFYDAFYLKALKIRKLIGQDFANVFENCDLIASPTAPEVAFKIGQKTDDPISMYLQDIFTIGVNLAGLPGVSIPAPLDKKMPVGFQLIGNFFEESKLLNVAHKIQETTDWHYAKPENF